MDIRTERLCAAFEASGLTQTELCKRTGINKGALSSYLSGRYFPKQKAIESLSAVLHVSVFYLMGLDEPSEDGRPSSSSDLSIDEVRLLELYRSLNSLGRRKAMDNIEDLTQIDRYLESDEAN